jgi:tyrocidine synthetase-3
VSLEAVRRALLDDPDIGEALVHITTDGHVTELIAHIVAIDPEMLDTSALSRRLNRRLPAGLVPTVVAVPYLPVNWDGSIDGLSLAPPESQPAPAQPTPVELLLRQIWADVLERVPSEISVQDRFFSLGGHSLNATQVVGRIARELGIEPGLAEMFRNPSLRELASTITEYLGGAEAAHEKALARLE